MSSSLISTSVRAWGRLSALMAWSMRPSSSHSSPWSSRLMRRRAARSGSSRSVWVREERASPSPRVHPMARSWSMRGFSVSSHSGPPAVGGTGSKCCGPEGWGLGPRGCAIEHLRPEV